MYKATRLLIEGRKKFSRLDLRLVSVKVVGGGEPQDCFMNAVAARDKDVNNTGSTDNPIRCGWIVWPYDKENDCTEVVQHWWNFDPMLNRHFDTSPVHPDLVALQPEYVEDNDLCEFGTSILDRLLTNVGRDLVLQNGKWFYSECSENGELTTYPLKDFSYESLLYFK